LVFGIWESIHEPHARRQRVPLRRRKRVEDRHFFQNIHVPFVQRVSLGARDGFFRKRKVSVFRNVYYVITLDNRQNRKAGIWETQHVPSKIANIAA
jgi:hypothetical protein